MAASILALVLLLVFALPVVAHAQVEYRYIVTNGTITITRYTGLDRDVTIPGTIDGLPVTAIGEETFSQIGVTRVNITNTIVTIGNYAFYACSSLTNVVIPNSVVTIGNSAFSSCSSLTKVTIPDSVATIDKAAFYNSGLTAVTIPAGVTNIGPNAFAWCAGLTAVTVVTDNAFYSSAGGVLFNKTKTTLVQYPAGKPGGYTIPAGVTAIGNFAFYGCTTLASILTPNSLVTIGDFSFSGCWSLTAFTIPDGVTRIGETAFGSCWSLTSMTIPNSVTNIGASEFFDCTSLSAITVGSLNHTYSSADGVLFNNAQTVLVAYPAGRTGHYAISNGVTSIGASAFATCDGLTSVTIPNSVTNIGAGAFRYCTGLTNATMGNGIVSIGDYSFNYCPLNSLTLPDSVTTIREQAFSVCRSLTSITIPNSVITIGDNAFEICTSVTNLTIGNSVTTIGEYAFRSCTSLTAIYFRGDAPIMVSTAFTLVPATVYYLPGTRGWTSTFGGLPTALWVLPNPLILARSVGVQPNGFSFTISWATNRSVVVDAATNLLNPIWSPVSTNTLNAGTSDFSDPRWMNHSARFYRLRSL